MSHFVLVHGAWEGGWAWDQVVPTLKKSGHTVSIVDLPGSFNNPKPIEEVTLESYIVSIKEVLDKNTDQIVLVGHSLGGIAISQAAERFADRVDSLIYVAAFLLEDGANAIGAMQSDPGGQLLPQVVFSEDQSYAQVSESVWREVGFHDTDPDAIDDALMKLVAHQATEPFMSTLKLSQEQFGSIPKYIIRTAIDRVFSEDLQDRMVKNWPVKETITLHAGHFPALSIPDELASSLLSFVDSDRNTP